jgi:molecular chaperone DnaK
MASAVGIDLGTTNTVVAAVRDGVAGTIPDPQGNRIIPSVVSFHPSGSTLVGRTALERRLLDAPSTIYSVKRLMGRPWDSPEVQQTRSKLSFELCEGAQGATMVAARGEKYALPEISAFVLRYAKAVAEGALGGQVERAVITVPANFNDLQRAATKTAGRLAGLDVLRILNEPTAAVLAYGPPSKAQERVVVYDLGGGTFDVTLLDLAGNVFEVLSTAGDTALGGDDIDVAVAERMADDLLKSHRFDARTQPAAYGHLRLLAERLKKELSTASEHTLTVDDIVPGDRGSHVTWRFKMTRAELEWASLALVERTFRVCQQALDAASVQPSGLDRIILVGGATRMPMVARKVEQFFGRSPIVRINPDEVVALGAAIQASLLDRARTKNAAPMMHPRIEERSVVGPLPTEEDAGVLSILPLVGPNDEPVMKIAPPLFGPGATFQPTSKTLVFDMPEDAAAPPFEIELPHPPPLTPSKPPPTPPSKRELRRKAQATLVGLPHPPDPSQTSPLPVLIEDIAPALPPPVPVAVRAPAPAPPAAPRAAAPLLIDVTPLSLSVETVGGFCDILIDANTPVPCDRTRSFATASDGQTAVRVRVAQGPSKRFPENTFLGEVELSGIPAAPRGETVIAVTFEIDADGILNVSAKDTKTGLGTAARIQLVGAQTAPDDVEAMQARQAAHPLAPLDPSH